MVSAAGGAVADVRAGAVASAGSAPFVESERESKLRRGVLLHTEAE